MADLRTAAVELLPLDANRREEALVHLASMAQAAVVPRSPTRPRAPHYGCSDHSPPASSTRSRRASLRPI